MVKTTKNAVFGAQMALLGLSLLAAGCYGGKPGEAAGQTDGATDESGDGADDGNDDAGDDDGGVPGECDQDAGLSPTHMRRLSHREYENTLAAMLTDLDQGSSATVMASLSGLIAQVPQDARESFSDQVVVGAVFDGMDHSASQVHVDRYYDVASAFAREIIGDDERLASLVGDCIVDGDTSNDASCIEAFVEGFGRRALRRPMTADELSFFIDDVYADGGVLGAYDARALQDTLVAFLMAPQFLYHLEDSGDPLDGEETLLTLNPHELASRMSYALWMAPPDATLRAAAEDGSLLDADVFVAEVDRLLADPRSHEALDDFFGRWWGLDEIVDPSLSLGDPAYDAFAGAQAPSPQLRDAMLDEVRDLTRHYVWTEEGRFEDLLTSNRSFASSDELAALYGVPVWQPGQEPPAFAEGERAGFLTRAALLVNGSTRTRPILKGKRVLEELLCQTIPPPPDNVSTEVDLEAPFTTRERVEALTEQPGSSCFACHEQLNPYGFATEGYDALGRFRSEELVFDETGTEIGRLPIDSTVDIAVGGQVQTVQGAVQMSELLAADERARTCFSRHFFRYVYNRAEDPQADQCLIDDVATRLRDGDSLRSVVRSVVLSPTFRLRNLED